jgi:hypothetical protein
MYPHFFVDLAVVRQHELRAHAGQFGHSAPPRARESHRPKQRSLNAARGAALTWSFRRASRARGGAECRWRSPTVN